MVDFKLLVEKIKKAAIQQGYSVNSVALEAKLKSDEQRLRLYKHVFSTPEGRWVLLDLMREGGLLSSTPFEDTNKTVFQAGERRIATYIAHSLAFTLDDIIKFTADLENNNF